ncbi:hypothetical protein [Paenibacillus sp. sgz5001063]|uniref:hypothetical protein n=1 Tax=Paenibacillus sp. sgz5001063 TaxID=3242474 RepID=UPI0036D27FC4
MDIHSDSYKIAELTKRDEALQIIRQAETAIAQINGNKPVTLIAYERTGAPFHT